MGFFSLRRLIFLGLALALLLAAGRMLPYLAKERVEKRLSARETLEGVPPAYALADGLLGGFRGFLISSLWMRGQDKKQQGQFYEMVDIYKIITTLEPNYPTSWANMAWDLSYNVAAEFNEDPRERVFWIFRGIKMLRDEAIRHNPRSALLYYELAWIYYNKSTESVDPAFPLYRQYLAIDVMRILLGPGDNKLLTAIVAAEKKYPMMTDLLAAPGMQELAARFKAEGFDFPADAMRVSATARDKFKDIFDNPAKTALFETAMHREMARQLREKLNLQPEQMLSLNQRFGDIDWRLPQAHSLYWAWLGQEYKLAEDPRYQNLKYERLIYFSLIQLAHKGSGMLTDEGYVIAPPDPQILDKVIDYMEDLIQRHKDQTGAMTGVYAGFENFLRITVFNYYFEDDKLNAERIRQRLVKFANAPGKYADTLTAFMKKELPDFIDGMMPDRAMMLLVSFCNKSYWYLANGQTARYQESIQWFEANYLKLYQDWKTRFEGTFSWKEQYGMPSPEALEAQIAVNILSGNAGYTEEQKKRLSAGLKLMLPKVWQQAQSMLQGPNPQLLQPDNGQKTQPGTGGTEGKPSAPAAPGTQSRPFSPLAPAGRG